MSLSPRNKKSKIIPNKSGQKSKLRKFCSLFTACLPCLPNRQAARQVHCSLSKGFTIIEVLISLAILTIILGAIYSSFFISERAIERFEDVSLKYHEIRTALDIMRREIEGALLSKLTPTYSGQNSEPKTYFQIEDRDILGKPASILRLTAFSSQSGIVNAISYYVEEKDDRFNLLKTESPTGIKTKEYSIEMIEDIESFTVETLFNNNWIKTWDTTQTNELPDIVRVSITFNDKGKEVTLTEYARPKIGRQL